MHPQLIPVLLFAFPKYSLLQHHPELWQTPKTTFLIAQVTSSDVLALSPVVSYASLLYVVVPQVRGDQTELSFS